MAAVQGSSEASNVLRLAAKAAACDGCSSDRASAIAFATAGMVFGSYQRCGFGVLSGSPSRCWTLITLRFGRGAADMILPAQSS